MNGISMYGCRENNLKNIDVTIPYSKVVCFVGVSGSGKSTLIFDTLYAEGKRRYIESLGVNEAYYLSKVKKPEADYFMGVPPAIALVQSRTNRNPRSTVGTISQIAYYLQTLFASCGQEDGQRHRELVPSMFNLNSLQGVCAECEGKGEILEFDETLIWPDQELTIAQGGLKLGGAKQGTTKYTFLNSFLKQFGCDVDTPIKEFSNEVKVALLFGQKKNRKYKLEYPGIINDSERIYKTTKSMDVREDLEHFMIKKKCERCGGTGYNPEILNVTIDGKNIDSYMNMCIDELASFFENYRFYDSRDQIWGQIKDTFLKNLHQCMDLGIGYLSLARKATTLSGGELQRLKIVAQISSEISGVVYVLDEPSSGLHASDIGKVLEAIKRLNCTGNKNTVVLVEHTAKLIKASDYIFEIGPGAGEQGGQVVAKGTFEEICNSKTSVSGKYLTGKCTVGILEPLRTFKRKEIVRLHHVTANNLKDISVDIPLGGMVCVTGVSGSGKTSLIFDSFYQSIYYNKEIGLEHIDGREKIKNVILCDQSSIGKSSRSCPATYLELYTPIRKLFAGEELARKRKYKETFFSFNVPGGRCEACKGEGILKVNMGFLPDMAVICDQCEGRRFKNETLEVKYRGKSIYEVLEMSISEAKIFFADEKGIQAKLDAMEKVGLGYLRLIQPTSTLSGGESQRMKLAKEISKTNTKGTLLIFDEPTRGLHFEDVKCLLEVMKELVRVGNSLLIVEHNLDVIASSDHIIDIGPGAGKSGGYIVGEGTPYEIAELDTPTGKELQAYFRMNLRSETDRHTGDEKMTDLLELRDQIDEIDREMVQLFEKRMEVCRQVAEYKIANGKKVLDRERELEKLQVLGGLAHNDFNRHGVQELFQQIMSMSRKLQYQLLAREGVSGSLPFTQIEKIDRKNCRVVYQGVEGAYQHEAALQYFGEDVNIFHMDSWRGCMEAIKEGMADYAVFPIENSSAGEVSDIYDLLEEYENYIVGEQILKIDHALLGVPGAKLADIRTVYSHPQALMQCSVYLEQHQGWKQERVANTAMAAKKVAEDGDRTQAAIGSAAADEHHGLAVLKSPLNHNRFNSTRFIIVTNRKMYEKDAKKVSICFELPHTSGSLYNILSHIIYNDLNMCKIESRPIPEHNWEYHFFVDFEGNLNDSAVKNAVRGIMEEAVNFKILGNY